MGILESLKTLLFGKHDVSEGKQDEKKEKVRVGHPLSMQSESAAANDTAVKVEKDNKTGPVKPGFGGRGNVQHCADAAAQCQKQKRMNRRLTLKNTLDQRIIPFVGPVPEAAHRPTGGVWPHRQPDRAPETPSHAAIRARWRPEAPSKQGR